VQQRTALQHGAHPAGLDGAHRRVPEDPDRAGVRARQAQQHVDRGGFPGPVGPEERHHLAGGDVQVDPADGLDVPETLAQTGHPDGRAVGGAGLAGAGEETVRC
jgi:hypothetical protein